MATASDWTGLTLKDRYAIEGPLGRGGMGAVYRARDTVLERPVVVKVPHARFLEEEGFRERFLREIKSLTALPHPHVVAVQDAGERDGVPYAVLAFLGGGSLSDRLKRAPGGRLPLDEVLSWLRPVAQALDFIHGQHVVHRDVKPGNILFDAHGHAFLADFGIAKALGAVDTGLTLTGTTPGSPDYMAPESAAGTAIGPAYDQYALAVVVFHALSGRFPHEGPTPIVLLTRKLSHPPTELRTFAPEVPETVASAVRRALSMKPEDRFPSCAAFAAAFSAGMAGPAGPGASPDASTRVSAASASGTVRGRSDIREAGGRAGPALRPEAAVEPRPGRGRLLVAMVAVAVLGGAGIAFGPSLFRATPPAPATPASEPARRTPDPAPSPSPPPPPSEPPAMEADPAPPKAVEAPPAPVTPPPPPAAPGWKALLDAAEAAIAAKDWGTAVEKYAAAKAARLPAGVATQALVDGVAAYEGLKRLETLAAANDWDGVEKAVALWRGVDGLALPAAITNGVGDPKITIESPKAGSTIAGETTTIRGTVRGRPTDRIRVRGKAFDLTNGRFSLDVRWGSEPEPSVELDVVDPEGNRRGSPLTFSMKAPEGATNPAVAAYLRGFAVAVGTEVDATTGYPKRIRRLKDDGEMVLIPAGTFQMGAVPGDTEAASDEKPRHAVTLSKAYYLDVNEVTVGQWKKYVSDGGGRAISDFRSEATDRHPVHNVDHTEATAFARWAGASLPTEAQWERGAKGGDDDFVYPWGTSDDPKRRNGSGSADGFDGLAPVRSYGANDYGIFDLSGNVWEWCADWYDSSYYGTSPGRDPTGPGSGSARVVRGGSFDYIVFFLRASDRFRFIPSVRSDNLGFRLARSL